MVINWELLKTLYLQGDLATQLNSLALNLTRIQALATSHTDKPVALHLIRESQQFIEWTVPTLDLDSDDIDIATQLVELQRQLSRWKLDWEDLWNDGEAREAISHTAQQWCQRLSQYAQPLIAG
ncbi:MAG: hypothetical protein HC824_10170 [Synechococcales cyanobacterium RM1_1_8]|nr:hypothetical protein [Synechococcales cyanobacterium RM1_1_8]